MNSDQTTSKRRRQIWVNIVRLLKIVSRQEQRIKVMTGGLMVNFFSCLICSLQEKNVQKLCMLMVAMA